MINLFIKLSLSLWEKLQCLAYCWHLKRTRKKMAIRDTLGSNSSEVVQFDLIGKPVGTRIEAKLFGFLKGVF